MLGELGLTELLSSLNPLSLLYLQAYIIKLLALREKCPDTDPKNSVFGHFLRSVDPRLSQASSSYL